MKAAWLRVASSAKEKARVLFCTQNFDRDNGVELTCIRGRPLGTTWLSRKRGSLFLRIPLKRSRGTGRSEAA